MRRLVGAVLVVVLVVGVLWSVDRAQAIGERQRIAAQQQGAEPTMTISAEQGAAIWATTVARQQVDSAALGAKWDAEAAQSQATYAAYRAGIDASVATSQARAQATNTALVRR